MSMSGRKDETYNQILYGTARCENYSLFRAWAASRAIFLRDVFRHEIKLDISAFFCFVLLFEIRSCRRNLIIVIWGLLRHFFFYLDNLKTGFFLLSK